MSPPLSPPESPQQVKPYSIACCLVMQRLGSLSLSGDRLRAALSWVAPSSWLSSGVGAAAATPLVPAQAASGAKATVALLLHAVQRSVISDIILVLSACAAVSALRHGSPALLWLAAHGQDIAAAIGGSLPLLSMLFFPVPPSATTTMALCASLAPLFLSVLGLTLARRGRAAASNIASSLAMVAVVTPTLAMPMEQLVLQLGRWLTYKLLLSFLKLRLAGSARIMRTTTTVKIM